MARISLHLHEDHEEDDEGFGKQQDETSAEHLATGISPPMDTTCTLVSYQVRSSSSSSSSPLGIVDASGAAVAEGHENPNVIEVRVREVRCRGLSFQIWPAAHALCWYLDEMAGFGTNPWPGMNKGLPASLSRIGMTLQSRGPSPGKRLRVLELGAGTGMVGIVCAVLGADCTLTDLPHVTHNLLHNAALNEGSMKRSGRGGSISVKTLRWGDMDDMAHVGHAFDLIVASDVVYYDHLFDPLFATLKWLTQPRQHDGNGNGSGVADCITNDVNGEEEGSVPVVLLAHLRRWKKDSHFFKKVSKIFDVTVVHKHPLAANTRRGVTVYCLSRKASSS